ncbi:MAG: hypothetical protein ACJ77E_09680 [Gaiellaceae bacterium]
MHGDIRLVALARVTLAGTFSAAATVAPACLHNRSLDRLANDNGPLLMADQLADRRIPGQLL